MVFVLQKKVIIKFSKKSLKFMWNSFASCFACVFKKLIVQVIKFYLLKFLLFSTMALKSVEIFAEAVSYANKRGKLVGIDIFSENYKTSFMSMILLLDSITYSMVTIYCIFEFYDDLEKLVFCLVTYGFAIQVRNKVFFI
jgi:hypothetical protein